MQRLSKYTNTVLSYLTIDLVPVQLEIDYRMWLMFGQLCRLDTSYLAKQIFVHRLVRFVNLDRQSREFTPDMFRLLQKYELVQYLEVFCTTGVFPSKFSWKRTLKSMIVHKLRSKSLESLIQEHSDIPVSNALGESGCSPVWQLASRNRRLHRVCGEPLACLGKVYSKPFPQKCKKCNLLVDNLTVHLLCLCVVNEMYRKRIWDSIIDEGGVVAFVRMIGLRGIEQCSYMICMALEQVDSCELFRPSLAFALNTCIK